LTAREEKSISIAATRDEATTLKRLNIILSIKDAYIKAIGQPVGFDYSRIDCDVPGKSMTVDGQSLAGWHIRLFNVNLGSTPELVSHKAPLQYQVAVAVFRGGHGMKFSFAQSVEDLKSFVTFFDVKEVVDAVPRLGEYDNSAMPPMEKIPLSGKNSMASIALSEKERERLLREKGQKDVPPVPSLPQKYAVDTKHPYPSDIKGPMPSSKSTNYFPPDIKHPLPPPPQPKSSYPPPGKQGASSVYSSSTKHSHSASYTSYVPAHQPQSHSNPIHTHRDTSRR
jgi:hypothetical protein